MSAEHEDGIAVRQSSASLAASENEALGLLPEDDDYDNGVPIPESSKPPSPSYHTPPTHRVRSDYEFSVEKNKRLDEVEPGLSQFREQRDLHTRQLTDLGKKTAMVTERVDKMNADIEKMRQQWGELERERAKLLEAQQSWEKKTAAQQEVVHKDDVIAKKYHDYIALDDEVLVLDDSDDENEVEDDDEAMYDWQAQGQGGGEAEEEQ